MRLAVPHTVYGRSLKKPAIEVLALMGAECVLTRLRGVWHMKDWRVGLSKVSGMSAFLLVMVCAVQAATYVVDQNHAAASNANPGTAEAPWLTIQHAADTLVAGDTVYIRAGVYDESVVTTRSGNTTEGDIVFSAEPGETPVIDGTGVDANNGVIVAHDHIKLLGLEIRSWGENAIWVEGAAFLEISDCVVHDVTYGVGFADGTHDFVCNRVEAHHFDLYGFDVTPNGADCYNGVFNDCSAHSARDPQQNVDGFALGHGTQHDFVLNRCHTYQVFDGFDISSAQTTLRRCVAEDCWNAAYKIWQDDVTLVNCLASRSGIVNVELDWDGEPGTATLINCTLHDAGEFNIWVENQGDTLEMTNCILSGGDNIGLCFEQIGTLRYLGDYNLFHNDNANRAIVVGYEQEFSSSQVEAGAWTTSSGQDAHSLVVDSAADIFVDPTSGDFHLKQSSPAIDHGTSTDAPSEDLEGNSRPQGNGTDIGAYEYRGGTTTPQLTRWLTHVTRPDGGFQTTLIFNNTSNSAASVTVWPFSMQGDAYPSQNIDVPANGFLSMTQEAMFPGVEVSHFGIQGDPDIVVLAGYRRVNDATAGTAHVTENTLSSKEYIVFPGEWGNVWDGMALVNLGTVPAVVEGMLVDADGHQTFQQVIHSGLSPHAKQLLVFGGFFGQAAGSKIIIRSSQPATILFLRGSADSRYLYQTAPIIGQ